MDERKHAAIFGMTDEEISKYIHPPAEATKGFMFQQTMLRIKDPRKSLEFYTKVLGMILLKKIDMPAGKFTLYFMGFEKKEDVPLSENERTTWALSRPATLELTHNWGTENDSDQHYHNGNKEPKGFGHIGIAVSDVYSACERFEKLGVKFVKTPDGGSMKGLAFIEDPDGYWIEIFNPVKTADIVSK